MSALPLFSNLRTTGELIESVERLANRHFTTCHWSICHSMFTKGKHRVAVMLQGVDHHNKKQIFIESADSISHGLCLLEDFITSIA